MKRIFQFTIFILILVLALPVFGQVQQKLTISGKVVAADTRDPLVGVNVHILGTYIGSATDRDGNFEFTFDTNRDFTLAISYVGYKPIERPFALRDRLTGLTFEMEEDPFLSEEVVVTGIASRTAKAVAEVSVSHVRAEALTERNTYKSIQDLLAGKVAGVTAQTSSGNLGTGMKFRMRSGGGISGNGQPVIYIDGVRVENEQVQGFWVGNQTISTLAELNPDDIEKVEILKGPAGAASYGTSGTNGVVVITTKRGGQMLPGAGKQFTIDYKGTFGWNKQPEEYTEEDQLNYRTTNNVFRDGPIEKTHLAVSGGSGIFRYYVGFDRSFEKAHTYSNFMDRTTYKANLDIFPSDKFTLRVSTSFAYNEIQTPLNDNALYGFLANTWLCTTPWTYADSAAIWNDYHIQHTNHFIGSITAEFKPMTNLEGRLTVGADDGDRRTDATRLPGYAYGSVVNGSRSIWHRNNRQFTYTGDLRYSYNFYGINAVSSAGFQVYDNQYQTFWFEKLDYLTPLISNIGAGDTFDDGNESKYHAREAGIFTEHQFSYEDTYFASLMLRKDYATVIGFEAPSIFYPRASFAVRLDNFNFTPSLFNLLKVRAAYGESGTLPGRMDGIPLLWEASTFGLGVGGKLDRIGNTEIKPERVKEFEVGFESELWGNYAVDFTYYRQFVSNSLVDFYNTPSSGLTASEIPKNVGKMKGWGIESMIQASPLRTRNYHLTLSLINNYQINEVTDMGGAPPIYDGWNVVKEGMPKGQFYYWAYDGVAYNDDGTYNGAKQTSERVDLGSGFPRYTGSFSVNFRFLKNFNFYAMLDWMTKFKIRNMTRRFQVYLTRGTGSVHIRYRELEHMLGIKDWTDWLSDRGTTLPVYTPGTSEYTQVAEEMSHWDYSVRSNFLEDGDFAKLREVSFSYDCQDLLPYLNLENYVQGMQVGFSAQNLYTWTNYTGVDPEVYSYGVHSTISGQNDFDTMPHPKIYQFWLRLSY